MRAICDRIVERAGDSWGHIGWGLFAVWVLILLLSIPSGETWLPVYLPILLWVTWWLIDAVSQMVSTWTAVAGLLLVSVGVSGLMPRGFVILAGCWVIYWMKVRE